MIRAIGSWPLIVIATLVVLVSVQWNLPDTTGLEGEYFPSSDFSGGPEFRTRSAVSTDAVSTAWNRRPPSTFSARWSGYLIVPRAGSYTFSLTSDDGSTLQIDDVLVVDNSGAHASQTKTGQAVLERGPHRVVVEYTQAGGAYELEWQWGREAAATEPVGEAALSPYRIGYATALVIRWLDALFVPTLIGIGVIVVWIMFPAKSRTATCASSG